MLYHRPIHFVILSWGRCGTEWLVQRLNSHPEVRCLSEFFGLVKSENGWIPPVLEPMLPLFYQTMATHQVHGVKILYTQLQREGEDLDLFLKSVFGRGSVNERLVIHLLRRNYLDLLVSQTLAHTTRIMHFTKDQTKYREVYNSKIVVDLNYFRHFVDRYERLQEWAEKMVPRTRRFWYEDLQRDGLQSVLDFLNLPQADLSDRYCKMRTRPKSELISNFDQLVGALSGTQYEWMLDG